MPASTTTALAAWFRTAAVVSGALFLATTASAQGLNPTPIDSTHPLARRAATTMSHVLSGDRTAAESFLRREGTQNFVSYAMATQLDALSARLGTPARQWTLVSFDSAGIDADVIVTLAADRDTTRLGVRMEAAPPHRIAGFAQLRAAPSASAGGAARSLSPTVRAQVVDSVARLLEASHTSPDTGRMIAEVLRERHRSGGYASLSTAEEFAAALTADMQSVNGDRHLRVTPGAPPARAVSAAVSRSAPANFGAERAEYLRGNVGYLRFRGPLWEEPEALASYEAGLRYLANADAVILDLRSVPGGSAVAVNFIVSHFTPPGTPEVKVYNRLADTTYVRHTLDSVPGPRRTDVPLYVLVDSASASAAEGLPFALQSMGRATIVGQRTAGAGRNNRLVEVGGGMWASVTFTRVSDPRTGREWEGKGVQPDIVTAPADALAHAHRHALERLRRSGD